MIGDWFIPLQPLSPKKGESDRKAIIPGNGADTEADRSLKCWHTDEAVRSCSPLWGRRVERICPRR